MQKSKLFVSRPGPDYDFFYVDYCDFYTLGFHVNHETSIDLHIRWDRYIHYDRLYDKLYLLNPTRLG